MKRIVNCETGEETLVPFTKEELAQQKIDETKTLADIVAYEAEAEAKATAKAALLTQLGITAEQAKLLLS